MPEFSHEKRLRDPSYSELVRALAFTTQALEARLDDGDSTTIKAQCASARALLERAQAAHGLRTDSTP